MKLHLMREQSCKIGERSEDLSFQTTDAVNVEMASFLSNKASQTRKIITCYLQGVCQLRKERWEKRLWLDKRKKKIQDEELLDKSAVKC